MLLVFNCCVKIVVASGIQCCCLAACCYCAMLLMCCVTIALCLIFFATLTAFAVKYLHEFVPFVASQGTQVILEGRHNADIEWISELRMEGSAQV
ncbi:hypothetical protein U1Q18_019807 [Sarracenia purpurea var. burkii]